MKQGTGMLLGKFLPPHLGHQYLVDFARNYVKELTVMVATIQAEPIPGDLRYRWMREMFPDVNVVHCADENPQFPHEHPDFWDIWLASIRRFVSSGPDYVFASEDYGYRLAEVLGARYVPVDHARELAPISGEALRADPMTNWKYIPPCVRPYYALRVCLFGPESAGKSTMAKNLAAHYDTAYVSEYARGMLNLQNDECYPEDIPRIARGQAASEEAMARMANRILFCDTDLITTTIWSEALFDNCPPRIREEAEKRQYDLYLLLDMDTPFVKDPQRYLPHKRKWFHERCLHELESRDRPFVKISGSWDERFEKAIHAVDRLLASGGRVHTG
ncbi:MAG: AAA family ATPase [Nitrospinota bacterium]|nr:AAA family ATPase [Nitrospinota bacterium]